MARRRVALGLSAVLLAVLSVVAPVGATTPTCAAADGTHRVALVIEHGDGSQLVRCVAFSENSISGADVLKRSGVEYATTVYGGLGAAVCQVDNEPASYPPSCWTSSSPYWAMFVARAGGPWALSSLGISAQVFRDGDAEGLRYESQTAGAIPPDAAGRCPTDASPTPSAPPAPAPTASPLPSAARTTTAKPTVAPTRTPAQSLAPTGQPTAATDPSAVAGVSAAPSALSGPGPAGSSAGSSPGSSPANGLANGLGPWLAVAAVVVLLLAAAVGARRRRGRR